MKVRVILIAGKVSSDGRLFEDAILKMLINGYIEINRKSIQSDENKYLSDEAALA